MTTRSFFSLAKPELKYPVIEHDDELTLTEIPLPSKVTLFSQSASVNENGLLIKAGERVKTGQKLKLSEEADNYLISTVTGRIADVSRYNGYFGRSYSTVTIDVETEDEWDDEFSNVVKDPDNSNIPKFLSAMPGGSELKALFDSQIKLNTIVVMAIDKEPLVATNQVVSGLDAEALADGINRLKALTGINRVILVIPSALLGTIKVDDIEIQVVTQNYPDAFPKMIMKNIIGNIVPAGKSCREMGVGFINAEGVVNLSKAFESGTFPLYKYLTLIRKDGGLTIIKARIGTPLKNIVELDGTQIGPGDRLILGGPMTGQSVFSDDMPVLADTDALMLQDNTDIIGASDNQCINCGECIRICPANVPVNMLVRLLENSLYEEAVEEYDLLSCIECGLCSFVCTARIPVFQHIMLGKYEFGRIKSAEESNA